MQYRDPKNYMLVYEALTKANRQDLIGHGPKCLIRPPHNSNYKSHTSASRKVVKDIGRSKQTKTTISHKKDIKKKTKSR